MPYLLALVRPEGGHRGRRCGGREPSELAGENPDRSKGVRKAPLEKHLQVVLASSGISWVILVSMVQKQQLGLLLQAMLPDKGG